MKWDQEIAKGLGSKHSDTQAVIRSGKKGAKRRTNRLRRRRELGDEDKVKTVEEDQ